LADALGTALDDMITADRDAVTRSSANVISEQDAIAVWQRAAQLQAEAAHRMERSITLTAGAGAGAGADNGDGRARLPTDAFRLSDVEAAAVEAGISRQFVALALAERTELVQGGDGAIAPLEDRVERRITTMLGTTDRSISASRVIKASPKATLQLIGRVFTARPYSLTVRETVNGHPLDGGILRFEVPNLYAAMSNGAIASVTGAVPALIYQCNSLDLYLLNVTLKARGTAAQPECEVVVTGDLRDGQRKNLKFSYWSIAGVTTLIGGLSIPVGIKVVGALALASPLVAGVTVLTAFGTMVGYRAAFRRALRKSREALDAMLLALQQNLDSQALFGELPAIPEPPRIASSSDDAFVTMIS